MKIYTSLWTILFPAILCSIHANPPSQIVMELPLNPFLRPENQSNRFIKVKTKPPAYQESTLKLSECITSKFKLLDMNEKVVSPNVLRGKFVGVYFSAKWCGPCRAITPILQAFRDENKDQFEVIFISLDRLRGKNSEETHLAEKRKYADSYNMNWFTINSTLSDSRKLLLKAKPPSSGIPRLVIFSPSGQYLTNDGTYDLRKNPESAFAKWRALSQKP